MHVRRVVIGRDQRDVAGGRGAHTRFWRLELDMASAARMLGIREQRILMRDFVPVFVQDFIFGANSAAPHAWQREQCFKSVGSEAILPSHILCELLDLGCVRLARSKIVMAFPHDMVGGSPCA